MKKIRLHLTSTSPLEANKSGLTINALKRLRPTPVVVANSLQRLGERIVLARKLRSMTQEELAQLADVSISTVRSMESGSDGVAMGNFLKVLQSIGLLSQIDGLLRPQDDPETMAYVERELKDR